MDPVLLAAQAAEAAQARAAAARNEPLVTEDGDDRTLEDEAALLGGLRIIEGGGEDHAPMETREVSREVRFCQHMRVSLDTDAHRTFCRDCETEVDSFDYILRLAREWESYAAWARRHRDDAKRYAALVEDTKRQLRNVKAQLRRAGKKAAPVAPGSVEDVVLRWLDPWRKGRDTTMMPDMLRWLLTASDPNVEAAGNWRAARDEERADPR
jgi:RNase P subunit RPR2